jgi:O-antigen/teichoic acid export membrane protein
MESIVILIIAWGSAVGVQYLLPTQQNRNYTLSVILGAVVNIIVNVPLIIFMGAFGASVATVLSEMTVSGYQIFSIRKQINYRKLFHDFWKYILSGAIMFLIVFKIDGILGNSWTMLGIEIFAGIIIYLIMLLVLKADILKEAKELIKNR